MAKARNLRSDIALRCASVPIRRGSWAARTPKHVSTSFAERSNLNVRMHTRRFTRLTNAFSKKIENHAHSVALFAMYYNFVRIHKTLRTSHGRKRDQAALGNR